MAPNPHWSAATAMTGRMNLKGRRSIARVNRDQEIKAVPGCIPPAAAVPVGGGTFHRGVMTDRPSNNKKKVIPNPVDLQKSM